MSSVGPITGIIHLPWYNFRCIIIDIPRHYEGVNTTFYSLLLHKNFQKTQIYSDFLYTKSVLWVNFDQKEAIENCKIVASVRVVRRCIIQLLTSFSGHIEIVPLVPSALVVQLSIYPSDSVSNRT